MMNAHSISPKSSAETMVLLSESSMQSKMLANLMADKLGLECKLADQPQQISHLLNSEQSLLLIDAQHFDMSTLRSLLQNLQGKHNRLVIALFNVIQRSEQELLAEWPQVKGLFYINADHNQLLKGLSALISGHLWLPREITHQLIEQNRRPPMDAGSRQLLTRRELQIMELLAGGATNLQIAESLFVSEHTIKSHLYNVFKKIDVKNRLQACNWARNNI
jgi:DNA-binding NarL/FixJ family response regulator